MEERTGPNQDPGNAPVKGSVEMKGVQRVELGTLLQVTQALEAVVGPCFGPSGGQVLFTRDSGEVLITRDGRRILTLLRLDHPVARVLVGCVSAHCKITGDGAKSFLLLLGALLRGIHGDHLHGIQARRVAHILLSFQTLVLDGVIGQGLAPRALSLLQDPAHLRPLTDAYFRGKTASSHWGVLSQTACEFYRRWRCEQDCTGVTLIARHFAALHTPVPGLPVSRSRVLQGLVIHRDFAVRCPGDGPLRALATSVPLQSPLAPPGVSLNLASAAQAQRCCGGVGGRAERGVACLRRLRVGLLLSAAKQSELALDLARRAGLSVVECVDSDELALFCRLAGAELFADPGDWSLIGEEHVATVTFCKPVVLGPDRLAHVGFPEGRGLAPHCLVLCGPSPGLAEQCSTAFCGLFRMLQRVYEPVLSHHAHGPVQSHHPQGREEDSENVAHYMVKQPGLHNGTRLDRAPASMRDNAHLSTDSTEAGGPQAIIGDPNRGEGPQVLISDPSRGEGPQALISDPNRGEGPQVLISDSNRGEGPQALISDSNRDEGPQVSIRDPNRGEGPQVSIRDPNRGEGPQVSIRDPNRGEGPLCAEPEHPIPAWLRNGKASGERPGVHFGEGKEGALGNRTRETGPASSGVLIEAGSVLPAGGAFEFVLHHCLLQQASQRRCPDLRAACRLVAGAVLSVPRRLYPGPRFLDAQSHFLRASGAAPPSWRVRGLESLACKYQLLLSVLHTASSLLSVDLILHTHIRSQAEHSQEEEEEAEE
ncbi:Bardet-Biedl syndrome 10 protein homolog isoform X1 [Anguilla anguilla]|uniref:Bardet-Biedl syndrome 10 protein homolog isoform X1 n=2 Tax=Anguilla anguilla TaxID=7936 RepID=UPI0015ADA13A|nr:Bardet-Biedl syndrome 10 protein homolog isoform X1 [Anguilla anguilla]